MIAPPSPSLQEGFSGDAWATLIGAVFAAAAAILAMILQRRGEQSDKRKELTRQTQAMATAMLFEIDRFYRYYVHDVLQTIGCARDGKELPFIEAPGSSPFPVYAANCGRLGDLDKRLVESIVDFYAPAQRHALRIGEYADRYDAAQARESSFPAASSLVSSIRSRGENLVSLAYIVCAYLCAYTGVSFHRLAVAKGEGMSEQTLDAAKTAVDSFRTGTKGDRE